MEINQPHRFTFPVGYHAFHKDRLFNYQLNRWYSFGYVKFEEMEAAGRNIRNFQDWKREMRRLAETALAESRLLEAAFYYRAAEFYTFSDDPDKDALYDRFVDLFYTATKADGICRFAIPYADSFLPGIRLAAGGERKGTIVLHGGFDSFIEEFYSWMRFFSDRGYDVIAFEGPGQGAARKKYGLVLDYRWEKPAGAVLDHFRLDNVTWLGVSMGGYLCFRAAAFEPRIRRVIASGVAFDYSQIPNVVGQWIMKLFFGHFPNFTNRVTLQKMRSDNMHKWSINNLMYIADKKSPVDAARVALEMNAANMHADLVTQDVMILTGRDDHFIPFKMHRKQVKALTNARSVTARVFTSDDQGQNHCQIGNIGLALDVMTEWIAQKPQFSA